MELSLTSTQYVLCDIHSSIFQFIRSFVCSSTHSFMLALTHQASQPAVCHLFSIIHFIYSHSFIFFHSLFILSFVRSFVHLFVHSFVLFSLIIDIFSLSDNTFLDTIFRIRCLTRHTKNLFCSKILRQNGRRSWD